ncbi:hypothetical protein ILYODFUR_038824 [Ilyodon furcidens]|uniref:Uncharacterized protein n=1 Tax=Ilyodon furcidens TaxID=33524 RepID=A0ABV0U331_9TELE
MSLCWQTDINSSNWIQGCHKITRSYAQVKKQTVCREFPAEMLSLRRLVERFPGLERGQQRPHHRGNGQFWVGPTERPSSHSSGG